MYLSESRPATIRMDKVSGTSTKAQWYHSRERTLLPIGEPAYTGAREFTTRTRGEHDLALVLDDTARELRSTDGITAIPVSNFLNSIGINSTFPDRGQPLPKTVEMIKYAGFRWVRGGIEGLTERWPHDLADVSRTAPTNGRPVQLGPGQRRYRSQEAHRNRQAVWQRPTPCWPLRGTTSRITGASPIKASQAAAVRPRGWPSRNYNETCTSAVKSDPTLKKYPVWSISEGGAEVDNVGLQFLTIPDGSGTLMPEGTKYADFANVHNYIYHPNSTGVQDNKTWNAADPTSACKVDGLYGNHGVTWAKHFRGYSETELVTLPRVTTETGCTIDGPITEEIQALNLLSMYLDQFKRGWSHTAVYLLRDRTDEGGNQSFGFFKPDYTPRKAAVYLHNLTKILADKGALAKPGQLNYSVSERSVTVHDMLLQKSDGTFELLVWNESLKGAEEVTVRLGSIYPATIYDPTVGTAPIQSLVSINSVKLSLSDHPVIIELKSRAR